HELHPDCKIPTYAGPFCHKSFAAQPSASHSPDTLFSESQFLRRVEDENVYPISQNISSDENIPKSKISLESETFMLFGVNYRGQSFLGVPPNYNLGPFTMKNKKRSHGTTSANQPQLGFLPSFLWICKQRLWVCGSQSKLADAKKALSEENSNGITSVHGLSQGTLVFTISQISEPGDQQQIAEYLWVIQLQLGGLF
ncbi:hypothetical protein STEG23_002764, partial [Scotinomys teguina]